MLVVKPNPRRMRYMRDSPSERPNLNAARRLRWDRIFAVCVTAAVVALLVVLALQHRL